MSDPIGTWKYCTCHVKNPPAPGGGISDMCNQCMHVSEI
jgi:hypothetical protein